MQNGHANGSTPTMQINPQQAAAYGLQFLEHVQHTRAQREAYDVVIAMLQAIVAGNVTLIDNYAPKPAEATPKPDER
jgi:hypothetical protein